MSPKTRIGNRRNQCLCFCEGNSYLLSYVSVVTVVSQNTEMPWKDIYADKDISLLMRIDQERYLVETRGSAVILPSVWDAIVRPGMTLDIRFPEDHSELDGRYARSPSLRTQSTAKRHQIDNEYDVYEFFAVRGTFSFAVTATFPCSAATFPSNAATSPFGTATLSSATTNPGTGLLKRPIISQPLFSGGFRHWRRLSAG